MSVRSPGSGRWTRSTVSPSTCAAPSRGPSTEGSRIGSMRSPRRRRRLRPASPATRARRLRRSSRNGASTRRSSRARSQACWAGSATAFARSSTRSAACSTACRGGPGVLWTVAGALVLLAATGAALWLARRRDGAVRTASGARVAGSAGPTELERLADEAEVRGDHEAALRLRFRAGSCGSTRSGSCRSGSR